MTDLDNVGSHAVAVAYFVHVAFQVEVEEFKDEVKLGVGVDDVEEAHDVLVLHFFEEGNLADRGGGDALVLLLETDLLEGDDLASFLVAGAVLCEPSQCEC